MKKILALLLGVLMLVPALAACSPALDDKGAVIPVYLSGQVTTVDPIRAYYDDVNAKVASLLFQCMTTLDEEGNVQLAAAKEYTIIEDPINNSYGIEFLLNDNKWSDGKKVMADDFAFAWRRVLDPTTNCEAACLLFDIKNAKAFNNNTLNGSKFDVGIVPDDDKLTVYFERPINYDQFLVNLSALALAPLREDMVSTDAEWGSQPTLIYANGPFFMKKYEYGETMVLERNQYYYRDVKADEYYEVVKPFQLIIDLTKNADAQYADYLAGEKVFYLGEFSNTNLIAQLNNLTVNDTMTVHTYYFNTTKAPFDNPNVRKALSLALNRSMIEATVPLTKAATGFVPHGVYNTTAGTSFRDEGGALLSVNADLITAGQLIAAANLTDAQKVINLGYRKADETSKAIAEHAKTQWEQLGFTVNLKELEAKWGQKNKNSPWYTMDDFYTALDSLTTSEKKNAPDVLAVDYRIPTTDAFSALAPFAPSYSGGVMDTSVGIKGSACHITGYRSEAYETLITAAAENRNGANRAKLLHDAEKMLLEDMPIIPIVTLQNAYMAADNLDGFYLDYHGVVHFDKVEMEDYQDYSKATSESQSIVDSNKASNRASESINESLSASVSQSLKG